MTGGGGVARPWAERGAWERGYDGRTLYTLRSHALRSDGPTLLDRFGNRVDVPQDFLGGLRVADFHAKLLVEGEHQLQGIDGVETQAPRTEQGQVIGDFRRTHLEHEILDNQTLDSFFHTGYGFQAAAYPARPLEFAISIRSPQAGNH